MSTTAHVIGRALVPGDGATSGERRALRDKDDAEARVDVLAAQNARRYVGIGAAVLAFGEIAARCCDPAFVMDTACRMIIELQQLQADNPVRESDKLVAPAFAAAPPDPAGVAESLARIDEGRCERCGGAGRCPCHYY